MKTVTELLELSNLIRNNKVIIVNYIKKDGTSRDIHCTLDFNIIPKEKHPSTSKEKERMESSINRGLIVVFDLEKNDWRSLMIRKIKRCKIGNDIVSINVKF